MPEYDDEKEYYHLPLEIDLKCDLLKTKAFTLTCLGLLDEAREYFEFAKQMKSE